MNMALVNFFESRGVNHFITVLAIINGVILGAETIPFVSTNFGVMLTMIDKMILTIFIFEMGLKLFAYRAHFFKSGWRNFDLFIIVLSLLPFAGQLQVLRTLRVLRILRLFNSFPKMQVISETLIKAMPGIFCTAALMIVIFYIFSVIATKIFGGSFPVQFGSIKASLISLLQLMTFDGWVDEMLRPVMAQFPYSWLFFIPFMIIVVFSFVGLFMSVMVDAMAKAQEDIVSHSPINRLRSAERTRTAVETAYEEEQILVTHQINDLQKELRELRNQLHKRSND